jgi:hypothetical protein
VISLVAAFCIFFGVDLATKGVERVHGPGISAVKSDAWAHQAPVKPESKQASVSSGQLPAPISKAKPDEPERSPVTGDTGINRISNKAGEFLHIMAYHGIKFFVSMLDAIFG